MERTALLIKWLLSLTCMSRLLGILSVIATTANAASANSSVMINVDENAPPFMYLQNGQAAGIYPRIINEAFRRMNVPVKVNAIPWKRALADAKSGRAGIAGLYWTEERARYFDFSDHLLTEKVLIFVRNESAFPFMAMNDLKGKKLATISGWVYGNEFDKARASGLFATDPNINDELNFEKLIRRRVDAVIAIESSGQAAITSKNLGSVVSALKQPLSSLQTYLAFAKGSNGALLRRFNDTLKSMNADHTLAKLTSELPGP